MISLITKNGLILDNGCGIGYSADFLAKEKMIGIDISKGMIEKAKKRTNRLVCADSQRLPFKNETFEVIFCRSLLHHLPNPQDGVREMKRVLKMNGELIISEPIQSILNIIPRRIAKKGRHFSEVHKDFKAKNLIEMLRDDFIINDMKYFGYIAYPVLGFPDVVDLYKYLPFKKYSGIFLIHFDEYLSRIPIIRTQSWGVTIRAIKKESSHIDSCQTATA
jgi:ubiquinone/menaquinone biosynthesis C-methylase UbiE